MSNKKFLLREGWLWSVYNSLTAGFLAPFALAFGASNTFIGLLDSILYLANILAQIPGAKLVEFASRKTIFLFTVTSSRLMWILMLLIPYVFKQNPLFFLIAFYFLSRLIEYHVGPAWTSLLADLVPEKMRGRFFAKRNMVIGTASLIFSLIAGIYLDLFPKDSFFGFSTLFGVGILFGLVSVYYVGKIKEPKYQDHDHHGFKEFFTMTGDFRYFSIVNVVFNFAVMLASPFFTVYMLKDLGLSYTMFTIATVIAIIARILAHPHLGRICDKHGDKQIALICMIGTALVPLSFFFITPSTLWLIIPAQILSGIVWAGVDLATFNLLLDFTDPKKRALQVAEFSMLTSLTAIISPFIGGLLADKAVLIVSGIPLVFLISTVLRLGSSLMLIRMNSPRVKKEASTAHVFHDMINFHPFEGTYKLFRVTVKKIKAVKLPPGMQLFR